MNNSLLSEREYVEVVNETINKTVIEYQDLNVNDQIMWEICKFRIKHKSQPTLYQ